MIGLISSVVVTLIVLWISWYAMLGIGKVSTVIIDIAIGQVKSTLRIAKKMMPD